MLNFERWVVADLWLAGYLHIWCQITRSIAGRLHKILEEHASECLGLPAGLSNSRADAWKNYHEEMLTSTCSNFLQFLVQCEHGFTHLAVEYLQSYDRSNFLLDSFVNLWGK